MAIKFQESPIGARTWANAGPIFYSSPSRDTSSISLGAQHYSYQFAAEKFLDALSPAVKCIRLEMPEFYNVREALTATVEMPIAGRPCHLIFRSPEELRLLKLGYNIICFAWEFDILKDNTKRGEHPFSNQVHMLGLCDEIWTPCNFTADVLKRHGLKNVEVIAAPIRVKARNVANRHSALAQIMEIPVAPMNHNPLWSRDDGVRANSEALRPLDEWVRKNTNCPEIFISVLNPEDDRKNMNAMFRGFYYYHLQHPNAILLVKLVTSLERCNTNHAAMVNELLIHKFADENIIQSTAILCVPDYLTPTQMNMLYQSADYYLCTSIAEGQNLPMLEAMSYGALPISPRHTAMLDYLDDSNSIEIKARRIPNFMPNLAAARFDKPLTINYCDERDVFAAITVAGGLTDRERARMSMNTIATVKRLYAPEVVMEKIQGQLMKIHRTFNTAVG